MSVEMKVPLGSSKSLSMLPNREGINVRVEKGTEQLLVINATDRTRLESFQREIRNLLRGNKG